MKKETEKYATVRYKARTTVLFTEGQTYRAFFVEYCQGKRDILHVRANDGKIYDFLDIKLFEVIEDPDNVLNTFEAEVKCITHNYDDRLFDLKYGNVYKAIGCDKDGLYLVMDESGDCYFYDPKFFEIISDPHGILSRNSLYYSCFKGKEEPERGDPAQVFSQVTS